MSEPQCCGATPTLALRTFSNGSTHAVRQCQKCLRQVGGAIPMWQAPESLPPFKQAGGHRENRRDYLAGRYLDYLKSGAWRGRPAADTAADLADIAMGTK